MRAIEFIEASKQFPFLTQLAESSPAIMKVEIAERGREFDSLRPVNQEDETVLKQQGSAEWALYVLKDDDSLSQLPMRFGHKVIYPAQNLVITHEVPDDIDISGETVAEAMARCGDSVKCVVLHGVGRDRDDGEFNRVIIRDSGIPPV